MSRKSKVSLSFDYMLWNCSIPKDKMTKSKVKMQKIIKDNIIMVLRVGHIPKNHVRMELSFKLYIPYFHEFGVGYPEQVKIEFDDACKFQCEVYSPDYRTSDEYAEVRCDGKIRVTIIWKN